MDYSDKFRATAQAVGLDPGDLHAATAILLCMDVETPAFRNMIHAIGRDAFARTESLGDIKRAILGYLVAE